MTALIVTCTSYKAKIVGKGSKKETKCIANRSIPIGVFPTIRLTPFCNLLGGIDPHWALEFL